MSQEHAEEGDARRLVPRLQGDGETGVGGAGERRIKGLCDSLLSTCSVVPAPQPRPGLRLLRHPPSLPLALLPGARRARSLAAIGRCLLSPPSRRGPSQVAEEANRGGLVVLGLDAHPGDKLFRLVRDGAVDSHLQPAVDEVAHPAPGSTIICGIVSFPVVR
eukprot:SAG22_NODE_2252_length_2785_cov_2.933730_2_plen_162_part_00